MVSPKYAQKITALNTWAESLGINLGVLILNKYRGQMFHDSSIQKTHLFGRLIRNDLSVADQEYINRKLSEPQFTGLRDRRTAYEYGLDLLLGWLAEDIQFEFSSSVGININNAGVDSERDFLDAKNVKTNPDFTVANHPLEFIIDWNGYWNRNGTCEVRSQKVSELQKKSGYLLGIDALNNRGFLLNVSEDSDLTFIESWPAYGGKSVYQLSVDSFITMSEIQNECQSLSMMTTMTE
jgi:hypothetical protein